MTLGAAGGPHVDMIIVAKDEAGMRLDRWFKVHFPGLGFGHLQKLLRTGQVRVDGKRAESATRLAAGQSVRIPLRGIEIEADVMLKGTRVDGVYTADPEKDPAAVKFDEISFEEVLDRRLKVMDLTAFTLCRENGLQIIVFDMDTPGNLGKVLAGERIGTLVKK